MYYQTPKVERYVAFILKNRLGIILTFFLISLSSLLLYQPHIHASDAMFWLKDSKEFQKTSKLHYDTFFLSKLSVHVDTIDNKNMQSLQKLQQRLSHLQHVQRVTSLFSQTIIHNEGKDDSGMLGIINFSSMPSYKLKAIIAKLENPYAHFISDDLHTFYFYIASDAKVDLKSLHLEQKYSCNAVDYYINWSEYLPYIFFSIVAILVIFRVIFSNYISAIAALIVVSFTTLFTFTFIGLITAKTDLYVVMPLITLSIAMVDYLYFYYRWHVSQYKTDKKHALVKMLNRNMTPALWTSILTAVGLGSLLFVHSEIIRMLSLSLILSSIVGYIINISFLPAFLSYFRVKRAHVKFAKVCYAFSSSELHYSKKLLLTLLSATLLLLFVGAYKIYDKSGSFFQLHVKNDQLMMMVPYKTIDLHFINRLQKFSTDIKKAFPESIDEVSSLASMVEELNSANTQTVKLDKQALEQALFYMDLYGLTKDYYNDNGAKITINIFDIDKNRLIEWLKNYKDINIYFVDKGSLINSAMYEKAMLLSISLLSALLIIGLITGWIFRSFSMAFVGFIGNSIPVVWFGLIVNLLHIPLSLEILIAMTIAVGLASDATIHFAFKYFRSRYFGRSQKQALEKMFFYAGIPVIVGSFILIVIFSLLGISGISSLEQIGLYSALLVLLSLLTDLFILPVILLFVDKFQR